MDPGDLPHTGIRWHTPHAVGKSLKSRFSPTALLMPRGFHCQSEAGVESNVRAGSGILIDSVMGLGTPGKADITRG